MKRILTTLFCICSFAVATYAQIAIDFNKGSFGAPGSGRENVWTSNNGVIEVRFISTGTFSYTIENNTDIWAREAGIKLNKEAFEVDIRVTEDYAEEFGIYSLHCTVTNQTNANAPKTILSFNNQSVPLATYGSYKNINVTAEAGDYVRIRVTKQNNPDNFAISFTDLSITPGRNGQPLADTERHPVPGRCYKITFPDTDPDGNGPLTDYYFTNSEDSLFVIGPSGETDFHNLFASNSNIASNHYLTIGGVTESTYTRDCAVDIFMVNNFHNALQFPSGEYLAYNKNTHQLTTSSVKVEDDANAITTDIDLIAVPYPYINVNLVSEWDAFSDFSTGAFGTVFLPFPMTIPEGIEAYAGTNFNNTDVALERVGEGAKALPAGAYLLHGATAGAIQFLPANTAPCDAPSKNIFFGSTKNPWKPTGDAALYTSEGLGSMLPYVLARTVSDTKTKVKENVQLGFYKYTAKTYPKGKVVFDSKVDTGNKGPVRFIYLPKTEGINTATHNFSNNIYDLTGRKLNGFVNGINIYNGKKILK